MYKRQVCGLALDFCVLDTCLNAKDCEELKGAQVHMVFDAARAAMIPGIGSHGSGFLSDPKEVLRKMRAAGVGVVSRFQLTGETRLDAGAVVKALSRVPGGFPDALGPLGLRGANLEVQYRPGIEPKSGLARAEYVVKLSLIHI